MRCQIVATGLLLGSAVASAALADPLRREPSSAMPERTADNAVYVEGGGAGLLYSINYERRFGDTAARVGLGYLALGSETDSSSVTFGKTETESFIAVPVTVSYLGIGSPKDMCELGAGAAVYHRGGGTFGGDTDAATTVMPNALAGYRHQPPAGGFVFRIGLSLIVETEHEHFALPEPILPWPYLALGGAFG
jgi:hypothetical protein